MPHVLLMHAIQRRLLERKGKFDKAGDISHGVFQVQLLASPPHRNSSVKQAFILGVGAKL